MVAIPAPQDPTLDAVDRALEARGNSEAPRPYVGASSIGHPCERKLWYGFRWAASPSFPAGTLKMFDDGHRGEDVQAERLRLVDGIRLWTHQDDGTQFGFKALGGHFRGHYDGVIEGLLQAPHTPHVWEHKQSSEKVQARLSKAIETEGEKNALRAWNEIYWAQAQIYMKHTGLTRHYLTCASPGGRTTISVRTSYDAEAAKGLEAKAARIIASDREPVRLHTDPARMECKWCDFKQICHGTELPEVNCRTCSYSTPTDDGRWKCEAHDRLLDYEAQRLGCQHHAYIPTMLEKFATLKGAEGNALVYELKETGTNFINGAHPYKESAEIRAAKCKAALCDEQVQEIREAFGGRISG